MKKLLFVLIFLLTSCSSIFQNSDSFDDRFIDISEPEDIIEPEKIEIFEGILQIKEFSLKNKSTHVIVDENENLLAEVKSQTIPLNEYVGKTVKIKAKIENTRGRDKIYEVYEIEEIIKDVKKEIKDVSFDDWKVFVQKENRYTFKYNPNWKIILANNVTYIKDENDKDISKITRLKNPLELDLKSFVSGDYKEVTVNGIFALKELQKNGFKIYFKALGEVIILNIQNLDDNNEVIIYNFINSFQVSEEINEVKKCGGSENILCPENYRCDIQEGISGLCVPVDYSFNEYQKYGTDVKNDKEKNVENISVPVNDEENKKDILENVEILDGSKYNNPYFKFTLVYPKSWWFKSFGASEDALWYIEFSEKEIENIGDGAIIFSVRYGARGLVEEKKENTITIMLPRDSDSHFEFTCPLEYENQVKAMAKSIKNES